MNLRGGHVEAAADVTVAGDQTRRVWFERDIEHARQRVRTAAAVKHATRLEGTGGGLQTCYSAARSAQYAPCISPEQSSAMTYRACEQGFVEVLARHLEATPWARGIFAIRNEARRFAPG